MPRALHLAARPEGTPRDSDFELREHATVPLADGQFRVAVKFLSIDPAMRVWMSEAKSYWPPVPLGEVMRAQGIGEIVESKNPKFPVGQWVSAMTGVQEEYVGEGKGAHAFDARRLPHPGWALSVFGATGLTAYFGLTDIGQAKAGEVLVVSAAAGAVGSAVVQIGKALGMRQHCPEGVDVYFDNVGGDILDEVLKRLRMKARIVLCGGISQYNAEGGARGPANYLSMISSRARMEGFVVIDYLNRAEEAIAAMAPWAAAGKLTSKLDIVEGLENFPTALRRVYSGANFGKQLVQL